MLIRVQEQPGGDEAQQEALKKVIAPSATTTRPAWTGRRSSWPLERAQDHRHHRGPRLHRRHRHLRLVPLRMAVRARRAAVALAARRARHGGPVLAVPIPVRLVRRRGPAHHSRLLGQRHRRRRPDRIRENMRKYKKMDLNELLNISINEIAVAHHPHRLDRSRRHSRRSTSSVARRCATSASPCSSAS